MNPSDMLSGQGKIVVILGINSTFGLAIEDILKKMGYQIWGTYFGTEEPSGDTRIKCDLRVEEQIDNMLSFIPEKIDAIINAAIPAYEDSHPHSLDLPIIQANLLYVLESCTPRLNEWGKIIHLGGQTVETEDIPGAELYSKALLMIHKWGMDFNERMAQSHHIFFVSYCLGMSNTRELKGWSEELLNTYRQKVPVFIEPIWLALSILTTLAIPYPAVKQVWSPKKFSLLVVR